MGVTVVMEAAATAAVATKNLFKIPVIHMNLNCYAEFPPPLQRPQRAVPTQNAPTFCVESGNA